MRPVRPWTRPWTRSGCEISGAPKKAAPFEVRSGLFVWPLHERCCAFDHRCACRGDPCGRPPVTRPASCAAGGVTHAVRDPIGDRDAVAAHRGRQGGCFDPSSCRLRRRVRIPQIPKEPPLMGWLFWHAGWDPIGDRRAAAAHRRRQDLRFDPSSCRLRRQGSGSLPRQNIPAPVGGRDILARCKGFEPLTFWSVARRSIQLS